MVDTEKVVCYERPNDTATTALLANAMSGNLKASDLIAMRDGFGGNNDFIWLLFILIFGGNGFGGYGRNGQGLQDAEMMSKLNNIQAQINGNQNSNLLMDAIKGNSAAIGDLSNAFNCSFGQMTAALSNIDKSLAIVGGQISTSKESVLNGILMGNKDLLSALQSCCCENKQLIQKMGYENQLATQTQTASLLDRMRELGNGISQGFASTAYATQQQTCDIITNNNANTQKIIDTLNSHWNLEQSQALQDAKFEISQLKQNQNIINALRNNCGCNTCCGC